MFETSPATFRHIVGKRSGGCYIQRIGYLVGMATLNELAVDPTLSHISTKTADTVQLGQGVPDEEGGE
jgi:hypothetical protein